MSTVQKVQVTIALPPGDAPLKRLLSVALVEKLGAYARFTFEKVDSGRCRIIAVRVPLARSCTTNGKDVTGPSTWRVAESIIYRIRSKARTA
ncbi:MAG TPA: hypothetical protein VE135_05665 [Pyrinomonadaceae bacterium]|nr:hypothetical protein [Pyrinomonadaceae bacterium]